MRRLLLLAFVPLLLLALPASSSAKATDCGNVTFKPDPYGSGGIVSAKNMDCRPARKRAVRCGRDGVAPQGWSVTIPKRSYGGEFRMKRGKKVIDVMIAGGGPPKLHRCVKLY